MKNALTVLILTACVAISPQGTPAEPQLLGRPVDQQTSHIEMVSIRSPWTSDYDYTLHRQGAIYFNDCVSFVNRASVPAVHIQFVFAAVDTEGQPRRPLLPLDVRYSIAPNVLQEGPSICRLQGYANGDRGLWLVAWVNEVDFSDGTSWHAPAIKGMVPLIKDALPKE